MPRRTTKKNEKKEEKKLKEQEKDVQEIAITLEVPRKTPKGTIVLRGATVVTMKVAEDEVLKNADIVVENNRIKRVGAKGAVPAGARVFDVAGKTIVPGFIDTHAHWTEIRRGILDTQNWAFLANLAYGVTVRPRRADRHKRHVCLPGSRGHRRHHWLASVFHRTRSFLWTTISSRSKK